MAGRVRHGCYVHRNWQSGSVFDETLTEEDNQGHKLMLHVQGIAVRVIYGCYMHGG